MKELSNTEKSLQNLAVLLGIEIKYGWKSKLASWLDVDSAIFANWLKRGLPKKVIQSIEEKGYPLYKWKFKKSESSVLIAEQGIQYSPGSTNGLHAVDNNASHERIIQEFVDKGWARDVNMKLVKLEKLAPHKKEYISGILDGILAAHGKKTVKKQENHN